MNVSSFLSSSRCVGAFFFIKIHGDVDLFSSKRMSHRLLVFHVVSARLFVFNMMALTCSLIKEKNVSLLVVHVVSARLFCKSHDGVDLFISKRNGVSLS